MNTAGVCGSLQAFSGSELPTRYSVYLAHGLLYDVKGGKLATWCSACPAYGFLYALNVNELKTNFKGLKEQEY